MFCVIFLPKINQARQTPGLIKHKDNNNPEDSLSDRLLAACRTINKLATN